jgi:23S rRNA (guanosine2251-2'-O)-methyltransferase
VSTADERVTEAVALAGKAHLALMEVSRAELDRMTGRALHQGLALQVPPYAYLHPTSCASGRSPPRRRCWWRSTA